MEAFAHQLVSGLAMGCIYAALGLALVMIYQSTHHVNFAQGEMATFSTFLAAAMIEWGLPYAAAFAFTVVMSFAGGMAIERVLIRRLAHAPVIAVVIVFIGLFMLFHSLTGWFFGHSVQSFPSPAPDASYIGGLLSAHQLAMIGAMLAILALLHVVFRYTNFGLQLRAAALSPASSRLAGVDVDLMYGIGWGVSAAIGAIAGMLVAPVLYLDPHMMSGVLIYAFAATLLGGIDNPKGAVIGGLIVGLAENLIGAYLIGTELKLSVALALILGVLIARPQGLFGALQTARV